MTQGTRREIREMDNRKQIQWIMALFVPLVVIGGAFWPMLGWIIVGMIAVFLVLTWFRGRYFCGWFCALGSVFERVVARVSRNREMLPLFRARWFRWLLFGLMMGLLGSRLVMSEGDPEKIGAAFRMMWIVSLGFATFFGIVYKPRTWCAVCPMGTMQGILSPRTHLLTVDASCRDCRKCAKVCPIGTEPARYRDTGSVPSLDCMRCGNCVVNCPRKALSFRDASGTVVRRTEPQYGLADAQVCPAPVTSRVRPPR